MNVEWYVFNVKKKMLMIDEQSRVVNFELVNSKKARLFAIAKKQEKRLQRQCAVSVQKWKAFTAQSPVTAASRKSFFDERHTNSQFHFGRA